MKIAYASRTGNVQSIVERLGVEDAINVVDEPTINEDYIIFTYTDGYGEVPADVEEFVAANAGHLKGIVCSGSRGFGDAFCGVGKVLSEQYNVPVLYEVENEGTDEDIEKIKELIK